MNYDTLVFFDQAQGIQPGPFALPATGPAYVRPSEDISALFYLEGHVNKAGVRYFVTVLASDLSTVRVARSSTTFIPRNAPVLADVDDINTNVGFWQPQPDFRIVERIDATPSSFASFPDTELEAIYEELVREFVTYQTNIGLRAIARNPNADLVMIYIEQPDGSEHQFLLTDPRQPSDFTNPNSIGAGQDAAKGARYRNYLATSFQVANSAVQRVINAIGTDSSGEPKSNIMVVSDHGIDPFHTAFNMNAFLAANGFDPARVRGVTSGPAVNFYINLQGREPDGIVSRAEYLTLQQRLVEAVQNFADTNSTYTQGVARVPVFDKIYTRPVPAEINDPQFGRQTSDFIGQDSGDVFAILRTGYNFDGTQNPVVVRRGDAASAAPILSVPNFYGAHGYDPTLPNMSAIFYAAGPDVGCGTLRQIENIDVAPTILKLLGVTPPSTIEGEALAVRVPRGLLRTIRARLSAIAGTLDKKSDHRVRKALADLDRALEGNSWSDESHLRRNGGKAFQSLIGAARELLKIRNASPAIGSILLALADAARELAQISIDQAAVGGVDAGELARAEEEIRQGDEAAAAGDFVKAIQLYEQAWGRSQRAR